jgi:hypothetical protein
MPEAVYRSLQILSSVSLSVSLIWWGWGLNSGLNACKVGDLLLVPHFQSILVWYFGVGVSHKLFAQAVFKPCDPSNVSLPSG